MASIVNIALLRVALHLDHHLMDEIVHVITYLDHPTKAAAHAAAALHTHRTAHAAH
jgi:hypothetical protein